MSRALALALLLAALLMARRMAVWGIAVVLAWLVWVPGAAFAWELEALNTIINQTNFILDNTCSSTLISVKYRVVLTNYHCVAEKIALEDRDEPQPDGTVKKVKREKRSDVILTQRAYQGAIQVGAAEYVAEIIAHKKRADLVLLRIRADTIPHTAESRLLPNGSAVRRGQRIYIVGNPRMLDASIVEGIVSSVTRVIEVPWAEGEKVPFYQVSGGLAGGNSGGALYTDEGYFIGVPAAVMGGESHLGFAIQLSTIRAFLAEVCYAAIYDDKAPVPDQCLADRAAAAAKKRVMPE